MSISSTYADFSASDDDDDEQGKHIVNINIDSLEPAGAILNSRLATTLNVHDGNSPAHKDFNIAATILIVLEMDEKRVSGWLRGH
jgi:hypothetical protein